MNRRHRIVILSALLLHVLLRSAWAATFYVSGVGSNANGGTSELAPKLTIAAAVAASASGDTISLRGVDTFAETIVLNATTGGRTFNSYGTGRATVHNGAASAFTATDVGGWALDNLNLTSNAAPLNASTGANVIEANFNAAGRKSAVRIANCVITGGLDGIAFIAAKTSATRGCNDITILNNEVTGQRLFGIYLREQDQDDLFTHWSGVRILRNTVHGVLGSTTNATASGSVIVVSRADDTTPVASLTMFTGQTWAMGTEVAYNKLYANDVDGVFDSGGIYGTSSTGVWVHHNAVDQDNEPSSCLNIGRNSHRWVFEHNVAYNCMMGMSVDGPADRNGTLAADWPYEHVIRFNVFANLRKSDTSARGISNETSAGNREVNGAAGQRVWLYNNTFVLPSDIFGQSISCLGTGWRILNNVVVGPAWIGILYESGKEPVTAGNLYHNRNFSGGRAGYYLHPAATWTGSLAGVQALGFEKIGATTYGHIADPGFADVGTALTGQVLSAGNFGTQAPMQMFNPSGTTNYTSGAADLTAAYAVRMPSQDLFGRRIGSTTFRGAVEPASLAPPTGARSRQRLGLALGLN